MSESSFDIVAKKAAPMMAAYQAKLLEIAQANARFTFDYAQAVAKVRSPSEFMNVITEYTKKRVELFQRHTQELAALAMPHHYEFISKDEERDFDEEPDFGPKD